jgi:hypothetical protein
VCVWRNWPQITALHFRAIRLRTGFPAESSRRKSANLFKFCPRGYKFETMELQAGAPCRRYRNLTTNAPASGDCSSDESRGALCSSERRAVPPRGAERKGREHGEQQNTAGLRRQLRVGGGSSPPETAGLGARAEGVRWGC